MDVGLKTSMSTTTNYNIFNNDLFSLHNQSLLNSHMNNSCNKHYHFLTIFLSNCTNSLNKYNNSHNKCNLFNKTHYFINNPCSTFLQIYNSPNFLSSFLLSNLFLLNIFPNLLKHFIKSLPKSLNKSLKVFYCHFLCHHNPNPVNPLPSTQPTSQQLANRTIDQSAHH